MTRQRLAPDPLHFGPVQGHLHAEFMIIAAFCLLNVGRMGLNLSLVTISTPGVFFMLDLFVFIFTGKPKESEKKNLWKTGKANLINNSI